MRYWKRIDRGGNTSTVESYSHDLEIEGAVEIGKDEFNSFIASLPLPPESSRNLTTEIDDLFARIGILEEPG